MLCILLDKTRNLLHVLSRSTSKTSHRDVFSAQDDAGGLAHELKRQIGVYRCVCTHQNGLPLTGKVAAEPTDEVATVGGVFDTQSYLLPGTRASRYLISRLRDSFPLRGSL